LEWLSPGASQFVLLGLVNMRFIVFRLFDSMTTGRLFYLMKSQEAFLNEP